MNKEGLNLFISYSHLDEKYIIDFNKHLAPLKNNGLLCSWHDRKIIAGHDFMDTIDNKLENADIICLFISANFLNSISCTKEKTKAIELQIKTGIPVIPIIISKCGWLDDKDISALLALPTDGKPIIDFENIDSAMNNVYNGIKQAAEQVLKVNQIRIKESFNEFLKDTELLSKAHSQKQKVLLDDIFVYPTLDKYDDTGEYEKKESSEKIIENFINYSKILIAGENQSGKTTLCKKLFLELRMKKFVPIYLEIKNSKYRENFNSRISKAFSEQYEGVTLTEIDKIRIVPIVDGFHFSKNIEKDIKELEIYKYQIVFVDDIFCLNIEKDSVLKTYFHFKIKELSPLLRNELIRKWENLSDNTDEGSNQFYKMIDQKTELVEIALGKILGLGIMPAYPFFILSVINTYETFQIPLNQEITSQGYCYQALIYVYLRKQGVTNDEIDTYFNFLTEFSNYLFTEKKFELSNDKFNEFMDGYLKKYNLPVNKKDILKNLKNSNIINLDGLNNYSFFYPYLYYYFVAKYLADHYNEKKELINEIFENLHKNENAYIAIFISHHSKNPNILEEVLTVASNLFNQFSPATLDKNELKFFDGEIDKLIQEVLPANDSSPESERRDRLKNQEEFEENEKADDDNNNDKNDLSKNLRRGIKTVEVIGQIIKNRAGSLEKEKLKILFKEAMNVHFRILSSFFLLIKDKSNEDNFINFMTLRIEKRIKKMGKNPDKEKIKNIVKIVFWNLNFYVVHDFIVKVIRSLGSDKLLDIVEEVCDEINSPASFLVKHGILISFNGNLQIDNIATKLEEKDLSQISKKVIRYIIVEFASIHVITYREKQRIESKLGIPTHQLQSKQKEN